MYKGGILLPAETVPSSEKTVEKIAKMKKIFTTSLKFGKKQSETC
jgi:hypothetical protein